MAPTKRVKDQECQDKIKEFMVDVEVGEIPSHFVCVSKVLKKDYLKLEVSNHAHSFYQNLLT